MKELGQANVNFEGLFNVLSGKPNLNQLTTYTALIHVASGSFQSFTQVRLALFVSLLLGFRHFIIIFFHFEKKKNAKKTTKPINHNSIMISLIGLPSPMRSLVNTSCIGTFRK